VVAQARGGVPIRLEPGAPGVGELDGIPADARVEYVTFGELSTEDVLGGDTAAPSAAGEDALDRLRADPRLPTMMDAARAFASEADLLVPEVAEAIAAVGDSPKNTTITGPPWRCSAAPSSGSVPDSPTRGYDPRSVGSTPRVRGLFPEVSSRTVVNSKFSYGGARQ